MGKKYLKNWEKFVNSSSEFLIQNTPSSRITLKYRNKAPSSGKLYVTNDLDSYLYKFTEKSDIDKLDPYLKSLMHMLTNKPVEQSSPEKQAKPEKKKGKKDKRKH